MKTSELIGPALDWAVAKCETIDVRWSPPHETLLLVGYAYAPYQPSENWAESGPIIERELIHWGMTATKHGDAPTIYLANKYQDFSKPMKGPTPLIAAMRCFVASKIGDEVEIPDELK